MKRKDILLLLFLIQAVVTSVAVVFFVASPHSPAIAGAAVFNFFLAVRATILSCQDKE